MLHSLDCRDERAERTHPTCQVLRSSQREKDLATSKLSGGVVFFIQAFSFFFFFFF